MENNVLDIISVQSSKKELYTALSNIKHDDVVVFENVFVNLRINNDLLKNILYNIAIYSEKSDVLIIISSNSEVTREDALKYLDMAGFNYHLVSFEEHEIKSNKKSHREFWFARDPYVVEDACDDTLRKNCSNYFTFEKHTQAELLFGYIDRDGVMFGFDRTIYFKGKINLEDKVILVVNNDRNIYNKQLEMEQILRKKGFIDKNSSKIQAI